MDKKVIKAIYGIEAPYGDMQFYQLNPGESLEVKPLRDQVLWVLNSQSHQSYEGIEHSASEFDRMFRSVAILARAYPDATIEEMFETAVVWERG